MWLLRGDLKLAVTPVGVATGTTKAAVPRLDPTDEALFLRYREEGDLDAFGQLYDRHAAAIYRFLVRLFRDASGAEDVAQHTFLRVHEARNSFDERRGFRTWIFTIARRLALNWLERRGLPAEGELEGELPDPSSSPEQRVMAREDASAVQRALMALSREEAEVLLLSRYEDLSYAQVGEVVGCSADAAKMRVHRALKRLAERVAVESRFKRRTGEMEE